MFANLWHDQFWGILQKAITKNNGKNFGNFFLENATSNLDV